MIDEDGGTAVDAETGSGSVVDFDAKAALEAATDAVDDVLLCVTYDAERFETIYADERLDAFYPDEEAREAHFAEIHSYVHLDFAERDVFEDLFIQPGGVNAFVTYMNNLLAVRFLVGDGGLFFALAPDAPATTLVEAIESTLT